MLVAHHLAHFGSSLTDALDIQGLALYLTELDTETAQLHLGVDTAHVLDLAILIPAAEVARMVHPYRTSPTVLLDERTVDKRLGRALGQSPVTASHLDAGKTQLACHTLWHQVASGVNDEVPVVSHTLADRYVLHTAARSDAVIGSIVGTLRRAIDVDDLDVVAIHTIHLLATTCGKADGKIVEGVEQQTGHRRRIATTCTLMVDQELADSCQVFTDLCRHDVERTAQCQHGIHILDMRIE